MIPHLLASTLTLFIIINLLSQFFSPAPPKLPPLSPPPRSDKPKLSLHLTTENTFNIAIISDLHYGEDEDTFGAEQDRKSTVVIGKILDYEMPDFVVISSSSPLLPLSQATRKTQNHVPPTHH
jgi:hypothetical protein